MKLIYGNKYLDKKEYVKRDIASLVSKHKVEEIQFDCNYFEDDYYAFYLDGDFEIYVKKDLIDDELLSVIVNKFKEDRKSSFDELDKRKKYNITVNYSEDVLSYEEDEENNKIGVITNCEDEFIGEMVKGLKSYDFASLSFVENDTYLNTNGNRIKFSNEMLGTMLDISNKSIDDYCFFAIPKSITIVTENGNIVSNVSENNIEEHICSILDNRLVKNVIVYDKDNKSYSDICVNPDGETVVIYCDNKYIKSIKRLVIGTNFKRLELR